MANVFDPFGLLRDDLQASSTEDGKFPVALPSGAFISVLSADEVAFVDLRSQKYTEQYQFQNVSDLSELDRCIIFELLLQRYGGWLTQGHDHLGGSLDLNLMQQRLKEISLELRGIKKTIGIDKVSRDRARGEGSVHQFLMNLLQWAHRFGIMRNQQAVTAVTLANQLISLVDCHNNCVDEAEQRKLRVTLPDIKEWIDGTFRPEFAEIDRKFRDEDQQYWIRDV